MRDVVITWLLTGVPDPQRGTHLPSTVDTVGELRASVRGHGRHLVVLHDCLDEPDDDLTTFARVPVGSNPYFYRWRVTAWWLEAHPEVERVWCVDGTDVEMLNDPFPHMEPGRFYVGSEEKTYRHPDTGPWLRQHCPSVVPLLDQHPDQRILNVGTFGGDRGDVLEVARALADAEGDGDDWELGVFQSLMLTRFPDHVTGPPVHTRFLAGERVSDCWWRHK